MTLLADESVDAPIVDRLRLDGHTVSYISEIKPSIQDDQVLQMANSQKCPLMTGDKDFGELVFRLGRVSQGIVLIRLHGLSPEAKADIVSEAIQQHEEEIRHTFAVISPGMVRIRHGLG